MGEPGRGRGEDLRTLSAAGAKKIGLKGPFSARAKDGGIHWISAEGRNTKSIGCLWTSWRSMRLRKSGELFVGSVMMHTPSRETLENSVMAKKCLWLHAQPRGLNLDQCCLWDSATTEL